MNHSQMDVDPLSNYEYPLYNSYHPLTHPLNYHQLEPSPYQHNVKAEEPIPYPYHVNYNTQMQAPYEPPLIPQAAPTNSQVTEPPKPEENKPNEEERDIKPDITKRRIKRGKKSTYWSEKIEDATYPFYTCSVCDVSYITLQELDTHVTIHKNRMTSYRLRLKNQDKKKKMKKDKKNGKKLKKLKIKKEVDIDIEIKPEDGYIGNEKASEYNNENVPNENGVGTVSSNVTNNSENNCSKEKNDEELQKQKEEDEMRNLEKIYKCYACKKQFSLSYYLKLHVRSHTDEKPYTCKVCGQSFITASKLGRHNKRIHLASRFQCRICFKIYSKFELLTTHFDKTHPEDKLEGEPYDYNAILPYLKELEEQLKDTEIKDIKPKPEDFWWIDPNAPAPDPSGPNPSDPNPADPNLLPPMASSNAVPLFRDENKELVSKLDIVVEAIKVDPDDEVKIKKEISDDEDHHPGDDFQTGDDFGDEGNDGNMPVNCELKTVEEPEKPPKDEADSDDDYFPSKTWLSSPKMDLSPPSPSQKGRRKRKTLTCEICHKSFSSASYMRIHMRTHTGEKPFKCYKCGRGFITTSKMHRHILAYHMEGEDVKPEEGAEVKKEGEDPEAPADEVNTNGTSKKAPRKKTKYKCLKKVKNKKEGPKAPKQYQKRPYCCEYCNQKFLHPEMLQVHKKSHAGEALVLRCQFCLAEASDRAALADHEATHSGPKPYLCTVCGKTYKKRETMVYHRKHHKPDREFICDICSKRFNAACKLTKHLLTHRTDKFVLRYECPVCAHMFNTKYHIQMHLATHQKEGLILEENRNEILAMVLQNARKIPKQPDAPANLTDIIPSDERSRICNICGEIFHHFYYLEEHLKSHGSRIAIEDTEKAEEKKYICPICNKGFKLHYYLKLHSFTHSKEKPFICQQCGKGFITKGKLKRHLETHTGLKKYQCHICCKFFTRPSYLRIHIRTIHGTQDYNFRFDKGNFRYDKAYDLAPMPLLTHMSSDVSQNSV